MVDLDFSRLLGFRLLTNAAQDAKIGEKAGTKDSPLTSAKIGEKAGGKPVSPLLRAKVGAKIGGKPATSPLMGAKVGTKPGFMA